jgi:hypothetical protein
VKLSSGREGMQTGHAARFGCNDNVFFVSGGLARAQRRV